MTTTKAIEQVARAICRAHAESEEFSDIDDYVERVWHLWEPEAQAAITAHESVLLEALRTIREMTAEMSGNMPAVRLVEAYDEIAHVARAALEQGK